MNDNELTPDAAVTPSGVLQQQMATEAALPLGTNRFDDVISGQFDADEEAEDVVLPKRVLLPKQKRPSCTKYWRNPVWVRGLKWSS